MKEFLQSNTAFNLFLCIFCFELGLTLNKLTKKKWFNFIFNPLVFALTILIGIVILFKMDVNEVVHSLDLVTFFLGPIVVIMGCVVYNNLETIKKNALPILIGIAVGSFVGVISVILLSKLFGLNLNIIKSLVSKSITAPMAIETTKKAGGLTSIVLLGVILTGNVGAIIAEPLLKTIGIKSPIAKGVAIGTASHAVGTTKALEMGEVEGAMSSLSIALCGLATVVWVPILLKLFGVN